MTGSKRVDRWTSGTVYECSEIASRGGGTGALPGELAAAAADAVAAACTGEAPSGTTTTSTTGRNPDSKGGARTPRGDNRVLIRA
jgi:hypothetical protein